MQNSSIDSAHERRQFPRIRLKAYGFEHRVELDCDGVVYGGVLVDISPGGARLGRLGSKAVCPIEPENMFKLKILIDGKGVLPDTIYCVVRWRDGDELGVQFQPQLDISVGELQKLLAA